MLPAACTAQHSQEGCLQELGKVEKEQNGGWMHEWTVREENTDR